MRKKGSKLSRVVLMGITLIILLVPLGLYYVFYVTSQQAYFINRSHRALAGIGGQIVSRIDGLQTVVQNAAQKDCPKPGETGDPIQDLFNPNTIKPFGVELQFVRLAARDKADVAQQKPKTDVTPQKPKADVAQQKPTTPPKPTAPLETMPTKPVVTLASERNGSKNRVVFRSELFSVAVGTEPLLGPVVERFLVHDRQAVGEDLFDKVFVADSETGQVIFEDGLDSTTIANLDDLLAARSSDKGEEKTESGQTPKDTKPGKPGGSPGRPGRGSSGMIPITIAETAHKLFFQPIELTVPRTGTNGEQGFKLTVCGLVRSDHLAGKTFSFSYTLLLLAVLLLLMTTVSGPVIKLRLMGPKDRLTRADAVLTACSAFFGTALLTMTLLDLYTYANLDNQLDDQLESLAASVDLNLRNELVSASDQLDALNLKLGEDLSIAKEETFCGARNEERDAAREPEGPSAVRTKYFKEDILGDNGLVDPQSATYPYFNSAIWVGFSGQQQIKFTTKRKHTPFISVAGRRFYEKAQEGNLWDVSVNQGGQETRRKLYMEPLNSRTSGENVAVISKLTPDRDYVSAVDTRLLSLYRPVLPAGYGFCVIDSTGLVLFHADDVKNLEENFFDECNNDKLLRAAVQLRQNENLNVQYLGGSHRAFVTPIKDLPWTLIVFRDKQIVRTINLEIVTLATIALSAYAFLLIGAFALIFLPLFPKSKARLNRLWPVQELHAKYSQMAIVNSALFLICLVLVLVTSRDALVVWALLFPALAIVYAFLLMGEKSRLQLPHLPRVSWLADWRRSYSLALVSMLALGCVAPAISFFKLMRDEQIRVFIRHGQMSLARGLELREAQVRSQYDSADPPVDVGSARDAFIKTRLDRDWDVYDSFFFGTTRKDKMAAGDRPLSGFLCWFLTRCSPFYNETCVDHLELVRSGSADKHWASGELGDRMVLVLHPIGGRGDGRPSSTLAGQTTGGDLAAPLATPAIAEQGDPKKQPSWILTSTTPSFVRLGDPLWWALVVAIALMLTLAYFEVRFSACRIFLLDVRTPRSIPISVNRPVDKNYLVVRPPLFNNGDLFPDNSFVRIDLSSVSLQEWWRVETKLETSRRDLPVVIDRFEVHNNDAAWNERKLQLVDSLIQQSRRVLIVSSLDPTAFPLSNEKLNGAGPPSGKSSTSGKPESPAGGAASSDTPEDRMPDVERWSLTLGSFVRGDTFEQVDSKAPNPGSNAVRIGPWPGLENAPTEESSNAGEEELIAQVGDQAEVYYRGVWSTCSEEERLTLFRVAQDGLVSRFDPDLRRLMQLGLIVRDPSLQLRDKSFRRFVLSVSRAEGVNRYRADVHSNWDRLKAPLLLILLGVIAFLFLTQKELYDSTISLVTALTGGVFAMLKLFGMFQSRKDSSAGQE